MIWAWLTGQFTRLDELIFGAAMLVLGLYFEDLIDRLRGQR